MDRELYLTIMKAGMGKIDHNNTWETVRETVIGCLMLARQRPQSIVFFEKSIN